MVCTGVTVTVGDNGADINVLVNLDALNKLLPHDELYANLILSPVAAAALLLNVTVITLEFTLPESIEAPNTPLNAHIYPVAATAVVVATGNDGAVYL